MSAEEETLEEKARAAVGTNGVEPGVLDQEDPDEHRKEISEDRIASLEGIKSHWVGERDPTTVSGAPVSFREELAHEMAILRSVKLRSRRPELKKRAAIHEKHVYEITVANVDFRDTSKEIMLRLAQGEAPRKPWYRRMFGRRP